jgi:hypothetical protein
VNRIPRKLLSFKCRLRMIARSQTVGSAVGQTRAGVNERYRLVSSTITTGSDEERLFPLLQLRALRLGCLQNVVASAHFADSQRDP